VSMPPDSTSARSSSKLSTAAILERRHASVLNAAVSDT
jgi:hypothetical protein